MYKRQLIKINNSSLIDLAIRRFKRFGIKKIIVNVSYLSEMIEAHIDQQYSNENIVILREDYPSGTGGALLNAYPELNTYLTDTVIPSLQIKLSQL